MGNNKFNALTSEVLNENNEIYTEALDYAFGNNDIKNIAITGIYGAGKSTVWNTYVNKSKFNNVITVSLGKYENYTKEDYNIQNEASETKPTDSDAAGAEGLCGDESKKAGGIDDENRVEEQIINQILSQIDPKKIPLSKYCFKSNKSDMSIRLHSLGLLSMIFSILLWEIRDMVISLFGESYKNCVSIVLMLLCAISLFVPMYCCLYNFYRGNKFRISKISFNGTEADMDNEMSDESVLDRDMKELVYLLGSSGTKIVVFEDLDRYNNISIYTKLRELNFILNNYVKINGDNKPVRFIYLLNDSLFCTSSRTKFFDFILPIVQILDYSTSNNKFKEYFGSLKESLNEKILKYVSYYVGDMRLLKNIVNEYMVYSEIVLPQDNNSKVNKPSEQDYSERDKLFALITLKNVLPNEFELLQKGEGYIKTFFDELKSNMPDLKGKIKKNLEKELEEIKKKIEDVQSNIKDKSSNISEDEFSDFVQRLSSNTQKFMEQMISRNFKGVEISKTSSTVPENLGLDSSLNKPMGQSSKEISQTPKVSISTKHFDSNKTFTVPAGTYLSLLIKEGDLIQKEHNIENQMKDIENYSYKEVISRLDNEQKNKLFSIPGFDIESKYLNLIRFLIINGLLDDRYVEFKVDISNTLKINDLNYIKGLMEGRTLDIFLDVERPDLIIDRLTEEDFKRDNILNMNIFKTCLNKNKVDYIIAITDSVIENYKQDDLAKILSKLDFKLVKKYSNILIENKEYLLENIVLFYYSKFAKIEGEESVDSEYEKIFSNILVSIFITKYEDKNKLDLLEKYIGFVQLDTIDKIAEMYKCKNIEKAEVSNFIENINLIGVNFENISKLEKLN
ncbi:MAG: hypothetical protein E6040_04960 [Lachnospiraceae bacterium]|nr:hypothetical protein [Lachnospiraceae bacterium]